MKTLLCFILFLFCGFAHGQQVDPNFNGNDVGFNNGDGMNSIAAPYIYSPITKMVLLPDGKLLYSGSNSSFARLNADGTPDVVFNTNTAVYSSSAISDYGFQQDGKIIVLANYQIMRLNADGTLDTSFASIANGLLKDFVFQTDGKIIVVGQFTSVENISCNNIFRLNTDGSVDTTFNAGGTGALFGTGTTNIHTIEKLSNGKMLILGNFGGYNGVPRSSIAVLNQDGTLDTTFNPGSGFIYESNGNANNLNLLAIQPDGKFFLGGQFSIYNGTTVNRLIRINPDGTLDNTFLTGAGFRYPYTAPTNGSLQYAEGDIYSMVIQPDGKLVIGGNFESYNGVYQRNIMRLNADGTIDASFHNKMVTCVDITTYSGSPIRRGEVTKMVQAPDGKIIIGGGFIRYNYAQTGNVARIEANGDLDLTFDQGTGFNNTVNSSAILPDGKIMVAGNFTKYFGVDTKGVARLNADGSLDATFSIGTGIEGILSSFFLGSNFFFQKVNSMAVQPNDNKVLIGGNFKAFNGVLKNSLVRLNSDGSVDASFNVPVIGSDTVNSVSLIQLLNDGKILAIINGSLVRLNSNGTVDASFPSITAIRLALMPDGRFYVMTQSLLKRYMSNGVLDTSFATVNIDASYNDNVIALQSDGRILIAGDFSAINNMSINKLARINTDGTLDMTFYPSIDFTPKVIKILNNDKILAGEKASTIGQIMKLYKLSSNGTLEGTYAEFGPNEYFSAPPMVNSITLDEGKIYLGGSFSSVYGVGRNRLVRLLDPNITLGVDHHSDTNNMTIYPNPTTDILNIDTPDGLTVDKVEVYNNLGQLVISHKNLTDNKTLDVSNLRSGIYYLKMNADGKQITRKFIKE
jgi:uncharacterized delta-60 repeat protein